MRKVLLNSDFTFLTHHDDDVEDVHSELREGIGGDSSPNYILNNFKYMKNVTMVCV